MKINTPILGFGGLPSGAVASACKEILDKNPKADGLLITQSMVEEFRIPLLYSSEKASVKARTLSLVNLGVLTKDEAWKLMEIRSKQPVCESGSGSSKAAGEDKRFFLW